MDLNELSEFLHLSPTNIKKNFKQIQENKAKQGIKITKEGRGDKTEYFINVLPTASFYKTKSEELCFDDNFLELPNLCTLVAFAMVMINTKQTAVSMTYSEFLEYIEIQPTHKNIKLLKEAFELMSEQKLINYMPDKKTPDKAFLASWVYSIQKKYKIQIEFFAECKKLIEKYNKNHRWIISMAKTWIGLNIIGNEICTVKEFITQFNITENQFKECRDILTKENYIKTKKEYNVTTGENNIIYFFAKGNRYDLNVLSPLATIRTDFQMKPMIIETKH